MAVLVDIADAVVTALSGGSFSQPVTAARHYRPLFDLQEMQTLHVTVVPKGVTVAAGSRGASAHEYEVDVAVQQKLQTADAAEIDPLMDLVEEIGDFFRSTRLASYPDAAWVRTEHAPVYAPEHMDELRQFTSVLALTFRTMR